MMSLTTYIEDASYAYEPLPDKHTLMSSQWFTWCRVCRHGGHAEHVSNWFAMNQQCPIAKCLCRCTLIDGISVKHFSLSCHFFFLFKTIKENLCVLQLQRKSTFFS
jgi:hypothetical protein